MARLHIGHSFITHSFLLKGEEPPACIRCDQHLTLKNILLNCSYFIGWLAAKHQLTYSDLIEMRASHFTDQSLRMLFQDISPEKIFNFLKDINIFENI